ncbi:hypothetical protein THAOC_17453 [Thalassiosira oceanica]|uniref:subtilisin n=1 Tax=Thalassiosira oceanica TaxID=159749 RepID=K0S9J4_THAOC|nr:hypothetical protein THAOC_17453 [Thalassiosira oceanica]|eukprot:EJK61965.1 hypothetical protein THAOC_17453 [Thalassiosira oceanica]
MVRYTSSSLVLLAAIGSSLAKQQKSILVGFSNRDAYDEVVRHATAQGEGAASNVDEPKMFRRPLNVGRKSKRRGRETGRKLPGRNGYDGNTPDPTEPAKSEPEMTIGYAKVDYTEDADIDKEIEALGKIHGVTVAELNGEVKALGFPTNEKEGKKNKGSSLRGQMERVLEESTPWGIGMVNITQFWAGGSQEVTPQKEVKICIIDSGYDLGHEDLPKSFDGVTGFIPDGQGTDYGVWDADENIHPRTRGHGTHVAGTIGAIGSNALGVVGVNPDPSKFSFHIAKVFSDKREGTDQDIIIECIEDCVSSGADVINLSIGGESPSALAESACEAAYDDGVLVIAAAGNEGSEIYKYPASYPVVMSVASVKEGDGPGSDTYGEKSLFSTFNDQVEIAAPGNDVLSTTPNDNYEFDSGTSMATPHVSAVAAWLISLFPNCEANQIRNAMINSSQEPPRAADGWDKLYGHGIVDAGAAYSLLSSANCVGAGGLSSSEAGKTLSQMAQGGAYQRDIGCTVDAHCYIGSDPNFGTRYCTDTNTCAIACVGTDVKVTVEFKTDAYPSESSWRISQECGSGFSKSSDGFTETNTVNIDNFCTSDGAFMFTITDSWGDGLFDPGYYKVYIDDVLQISEGPPVNFASTYTKSFGSCTTPPPTTPAPVTSQPTTGIPTNQPSPPPVPVTANPTSGCSELKVDVLTDRYAYETSYVIRDLCDEGKVLFTKDDFDQNEFEYTETYCVSDGMYEFEISDSYGSGSYTVHMDGELKAEGGNFGASEKTEFGSCGGNSTPRPTASAQPSPTSNPTTSNPTTSNPTTSNPTTANPTTSNPTKNPTSDPTANPTTAEPSKNPTSSPTTPEPTKNPTTAPTPSPSTKPTNSPTSDPTSQPSPSPVTPTDTTIKVELLLDDYPEETSWSIIDTCEGGGEIVSGDNYTVAGEAVSVEVTVPRGRFMMNIIDTFGDGVCCNHGQGKYEVFMDGLLVADGDDFDAMESHFFGNCGDGPQTQKPTGEPTTNATPRPSNATPRPSSSPVPASFDALVGTPACNDIQSICSTAGTSLLDKKEVWGELNPSNTLDNCADGGAGTYLIDESVESVTVVATDSAGNPVEGVLSAGGFAKIKAVVHAWNNGAGSYVDFFKTSDIASPNWVPLNDGTSPVGQGGLVDVESPAFQLSNTAAIQAVRVGIRFQGSQSPCPTGGYDENDDLVFKVDMTTASDAVMVALAPPATASPPSTPRGD